MGRLSRDKRDVFYRLAKEQGYRARSAYKLLQLDNEFHLLTKGIYRAVDLCAAPGSWSQVLCDKLYEINTTTTSTTDENDNDITNKIKIVAVDLQPMAPIDNVITIQGDITSTKTAQEIISNFSNTTTNTNSIGVELDQQQQQQQRAQIVVCDGAPDVTGLHNVDEYLQGQLLVSALLITTHVLCVHGTFVAKIFRGSNIGFLYNQLRLLFTNVTIAKPSSSRNSSMESFVVCTNFIGSPYYNIPLNINGYINLNQYINNNNNNNNNNFDNQTSNNIIVNVYDDDIDDDDNDDYDYIQRYAVPFIACGDLSGFQPKHWKSSSHQNESIVVLDSDKSYPIIDSVATGSSTTAAIAPIAPPINPPYQESLQRERTTTNTTTIQKTKK